MNFDAITDLLERVGALQEEQHVFLQRVDKLNEKADTISEVVYRKIMGDYRHKLDQLNAELYPLYDQLKLKRTELINGIEEIEEELKAYMIEKEEISVRCELGEFDKKEADKMIAELEKANEDKFERLNELKGYRERVEQALAEEVEGEAAMPEFDASDMSSQPPEVSGTEPEIPVSEESEPTPEPDEPIVPDDATGTVPGDVPLPPPPPVDETEKTVLDMGAELEQGSTVLMRTPTLTAQSGELAGTEFRLKMGVTNIGSGPSNDIVLTHPSVAEQHAQVTFGPDGFTIYDYKTDSGISVNGRKVSEHLLQDGDAVMIGEVPFTFHN